MKQAWTLGTVFACALMGAAFTNALAFDSNRLTQQGDVYPVALREGYLAHAQLADRAGDEARATFWNTRAAHVEQQVARRDFEMALLPPAAIKAQDAYRRDALANAYEETAALISSEAADEEPARVAAVQIDYEQWLYDAHQGATDRAFAKDWSQWDQAMGDMVDQSDPDQRPDIMGANPATGASG